MTPSPRFHFQKWVKMKFPLKPFPLQQKSTLVLIYIPNLPTHISQPWQRDIYLINISWQQLYQSTYFSLFKVLIPVYWKLQVPDMYQPYNNHWNKQKGLEVLNLYPHILSHIFYLLHIFFLHQVCIHSRIQHNFSAISRTLHPQLIS